MFSDSFQQKDKTRLPLSFYVILLMVNSKTTAGQFFKIFSYSFQQKSKTCSYSSCSYSWKCFWIPFSKKPRHIYLHQVHVILLMLTAETVTLNNWTILQNVFCILFRKYSRHIHLRHVYVVDAKSLSIVSICKRKKKLNYWTILQNVFSLFLAKGQDIFTFVISRNFAHGEFRKSKRPRHVHLRHAHILRNVFGFLLAKGQGTFIDIRFT